MHDTASYLRLLTPGQPAPAEYLTLIESVRFDDPAAAWKRLLGFASTDSQRQSLARAMPALLAALEEAATPDQSLVHLDQYLQSTPGPDQNLAYLADHPRAVEILVRLFVGSSYLTQVLQQNPGYLARLTQYNQLSEIKSREQFLQEGLTKCASAADWPVALTELRKFQKWELLRIATCDKFGLLDFKSTTLQLSLLADGIVQALVQLASQALRIDTADFCVLAMGKLGGEELNYSSDIDLVFVCEGENGRYSPLAQRLIRGLSDPSANGFFYRVDMRLRPWGRAGALVTTRPAYVEYLRREGRLWEKQALLKARQIAGNLALGTATLRDLQPLIFDVDPEQARLNVKQMKGELEALLESQGLLHAEVKNGIGGIRDIEFTTQLLQLIHGGRHPGVRSANTLDGIVRLADHDLIHADEYRQLTGGYMFLRSVEHSLQLRHNQQQHVLPKSRRELESLARRIDFPGPTEFLAYHDRHRAAIRRIFDKYVLQLSVAPAQGRTDICVLALPQTPGYAECFHSEQLALHTRLLSAVSRTHRVVIDVLPQGPNQWELTIAGIDEPGCLSVICGLLLSHRLDIESGDIFTGPLIAADSQTGAHRRFVDVLRIRSSGVPLPEGFWAEYETELRSHLAESHTDSRMALQARLARTVSDLVEFDPESAAELLPLEIEFDNNSDPIATILRISAEDTLGFLYEFTNALTLNGVMIQRVAIRTIGRLASDTLYVTDESGGKITDARRLSELRAAVLLTKHFTHLLPQSANPEAALLRFRDLLMRLFERPDWSEKVASLDRLEVLGSLSRLLGMSDFVGEELLKQDFEQVIPFVADSNSAPPPKRRAELQLELMNQLAECPTFDQKRERLNEFKDRERLRVDLSHILGRIDSFTEFASELTDIAEVTVESAIAICRTALESLYGPPLRPDGQPCRMTVAALGKCGGRELGFASDIELMIVYEATGHTQGPQSISNEEFHDRLVEEFSKTIRSRRQGIFEIDLRLRPHGKAGSPAVQLRSFESYFAPNGPAWPYERQALVKLRPICGDSAFGQELLQLRDRLIYRGQGIDIASQQAIRDKQIGQLVTPGTFHAKLSPGGLVDIEYLIQGLQIRHGLEHPEVRTPNTRDAMKALEQCGVLSASQRLGLRDAYRFFRRLIDAMRMVRGDARDLTVPAQGSDEFRFLERRLRLFKDSTDLMADIDSYSKQVCEIQGELRDQYEIGMSSP